MAAIPPMLIKLMMMTTSSNDAEALVALRKANALLSAANVNWEEFLNAVSFTRPKEDQSYRTPPSQRQYKSDDANVFTDVRGEKHDDDKLINKLFEQAFRNAGRGGFRDFLESVHEWWETKGYLTDKQFQSLKRAAER